jgi:phosphoribosylformylglycinamidine synthase
VAKIDKYLYKRIRCMRFRAIVEVGLKPGHSDPEGETTRQSLEELNYKVKSVSVSKVYEVLLEAGSKGEARKLVDEMCKRLLANPVKDNYRFEIEEAK